MTGRLTSLPRPEWAPAARGRDIEIPEHRCAICWSQYGKSAIPCPNEPKTETKENEL